MSETTDNNAQQEQQDDNVPRYCTSALPGQVFQEIYTCRACCEQNACLCQACADTCHAQCRIRINDDEEEEEAVEYVGMGPASCDCHVLDSKSACQLHRVSVEKAKTLLGNTEWDAVCTSPRQQQQQQQQRQQHDPSTTTIPAAVHVYDIDSLQQQQQAVTVIAQAALLVQYSKETFWIDRNNNNNNNNTVDDNECLLERLARQVLEFHAHNDDTYRGAEWWVQVKQMPQSTNTDDDIAAAAAAIDMHYDKDEVLAETFGLGAFPAWSTITYLTTNGAPTLIFPRTYHDGPDRVMSHVYLSRPTTGKHVKFDGSLLHGAIPLDMSNSSTAKNQWSQPQDASSCSLLRVTFLVNLWKDHQPMGIHPLPDDIRQVLSNESNGSISLVVHARDNAVISTVEATATDDWIGLPFVQDGMVVKTIDLARFIMPGDGEKETTTAPDVVCVQFKQGSEAYLDYSDNDDEDDKSSNGDENE